jgi:REP element-mobilizing transposase RayT
MSAGVSVRINVRGPLVRSRPQPGLFSITNRREGEKCLMHSRTRGYLPHVEESEGIYFLTFRLADSLPSSVLSGWKQELHRKQYGICDHRHLKALDYEYKAKVQSYLDQSYGQCWLRIPEIASVVDGAIRYFNHQRYELLAWTIMPNHVHVLFQLHAPYNVRSVMHSWKSFTAHEANKLLRRTGEFWQPEYFDRLITSSRQLEFTLRYILNNPVKAGFCKEVSEWRWTGCSEEMQSLAHRFFL